MATTSETMKWLAGLPKRDCYQAINRMFEGDRRTAVLHAAALARREPCSCIGCIRAEYSASGRAIPSL